MELLQVDTVADAITKIKDASRGVLPRVTVKPLAQALGTTLAEAAAAPEDVPGFDRSTVDGYAVLADDTAGAGESLPCFLKIVGEVEMGKPAPCSIRHGECAYVPTGGMLPPGADAVVMVEYCDRFADSVAVADAVSPGRNVIWRGEDIKAGQNVLEAGCKLRPSDIGVLAAIGKEQVKVWEGPKIAVFSTGDEIVPPGREKLETGQVRDINSNAVAAMATQAGFRVTATGIIPDVEERLRETLKQAMAENDVVVVSGGSSQGVKDMTERVIDSISSPGILSHGLAVKPGKPTIIGWDDESGTLFIGLPGHPVSAMIVFDSVLLDWWRQATGQTVRRPMVAKLDRNVMGSPGRETYQPVRLQLTSEGWLAEPVFYRSGLISALAAADGFFVLERNREGLSAGEQVLVYLY
ncbi:MAG: molybdopterin molybdotransferase MoeA [Firmicutes bacterium]|nr:molybdopterin molybdotransferase MoeA [Bacillota bacterium]